MKLSNKKSFGLILTVFAWILSLNVASLPQDIWTPELQMKVKSFSSLSVSPDGKKVAYTITDAVMTADKSEMNTQIFLGDVSGNNRQITSGEKSSTNPKWSPDGKKLAFLSNRKENRNYIYLINPETNEIIQLTETKTSISAFEWSPDGKFIAFTMSDAKTPEEEINDKAKSDHRWIDEVVKQTRLYLIEIGSEISQVKPVPINLTPGNMSISTDFNWSPDSRKIAFSHSRSQRIDDWKSLDISVVEVTDKKIQTLVATPTAEFAPFFSPDGKNIAFVMNDDPPHWAQKSAIYIVSASGGGKPRLLAETENNLPTISGWSGDGKQIFFYELNKTAVKIYSLDAASKRVAEVNLQDDEVYQNITLNRAGEVFGFTRQKNDAAPEVYLCRTDAFKPIQISRANADLPQLTLGKTEIIRWKSKDGKEIEGLLTYPVNFQKGKKVPLVLSIHGGPAEVYQQNFLANRYAYPYASFASHGFATLRPNPRGSTGYGAEFRRANIKNWGSGDYDDVMTGIDKVIEMGVADPNRLGVMGWSYGGFLASTILTKTKRFKASAIGAPVTNLIAFTANSDLQNLIPDYLGGEYWNEPVAYQKISPIFNIKAVSTPTLIVHGEADFRVPISQSYELYYALKRQNVPVRMLVLPRQPHGPNEPKMLLITMQTQLDWFVKYLK